MAAKERLIGLLRYVEELARLAEPTVFSVRSYRTLLFFEHELQNRVGIQHDVAEPDGQVWIRIERLQRNDPPPPEPSIAKWIVVSRDPDRPPEILETRLEKGMQLTDAELLVNEKKVDVADVMKSTIDGRDVVDVRFRLDRLPDVKEAIESYLSGPWQKWSDEEKPRRETIAIYDKFFNLVQLIESSGVEAPTEVVFGIGMVLWRIEGKKVEHPLIEVLIEIDIDPKSHALRVRPREADPQVYLKPFVELGNPAVNRLGQYAREFFAKLANLDAEVANADQVEFSPFHRGTFEAVLQMATAVLATGRYYPDVSSDPTERSLPEVDDNLTITDTWAVYARPRSANLFVQDVQRLKDAVNKAELLPRCAERLVSKPPEEESCDFIDLQQGIGAFSGNGGLDTFEPDSTDPDVFFPKVFNDAQVEIIRRLEKQDGVVVQGPPGTGKTHTIANIVCHYLATGRSVLVVSKGEPALQVLREHIPEEIRDLTISLLTSEREGLKQLETAVTCMANDVANRDTRRLERDLRDHETEIVRLRQRISENDQQVCRLAELQLKPVLNFNVRPAELAQQIVTDAEKHEWLPDRLGHDDCHNPKFSNDDIKTARRARQTLGTDLAYIDHALPSVNDLPDSASISSVHSDLVRAENLTRSAQIQHLPQMSTRAPQAVAQAEQMLLELRDVRSALERMSLPNQVWLRRYYDIWLTEGADSERTRPLKLLINELTALQQQRQRFLERPVQIPMLRRSREDLFEAVQRAKVGGNPFRLLSFGKRDAKEAYVKIKVGAQRPKTRTDWQHVSDYFEFQNSLAAFVERWNVLANELQLPEAPVAFDQAVNWSSELRSNAEAVFAVAKVYREATCPAIRTLFSQGLNADLVACDKQAVNRAIETLEANIAVRKLAGARVELEVAIERLQKHSGQIVQNMLVFLRETVGRPTLSDKEITSRWLGLVQELRRLQPSRPSLNEVARVAQLIEASGAPIWADKLRTEPVTGGSDPWTVEKWDESWQFRRLEAYIRQIECREELKRLAEERVECEKRLRKAMTELVRVRTYLGIKRRLTPARHSALNEFVAAIHDIGAGTGIRARRYRGDARRAMSNCIEAVPCWIMPTWRASESLPPALGAFDLIIVDEASQSDAMALPALLRANKLLIVGDDKQVSPSPIGIEERRILQLRHSYLDDQPFAAALMPGSSLYRLGLSVFPTENILLNEHFRCVEPIIRFSFQFYPKRIEPVRIPKPSERLDPPLVDVYLPHGERDSQKTNRVEGIAIVDEIERLVNDPAYEKRTIGVVCLIGSKQAYLIQSLLIERIGEALFLKHKIACGDAATFQGKERDIMFVSMIASPGKATAQTALLWQQRFNVALSRARDRMYLFRSVKPEDLQNPRDLKLRVINHFLNPMPAPLKEVEELTELCESGFEREVFRQLAKLGYRVTPQVSVGEFRIDLVVDGDHDRRLAIELDGDHHHGPDRWFEDWNRQKILERAGWTFWRCWASSFALDPDGCMGDLIATLNQMQIEPIGAGEARSPYTDHRVIQLNQVGNSVDRRFDSESLEPVVEIGDKLIVSFEDTPNRHFALIMTADETDLVNGILSANDSPGKHLLGARAEEEVVLDWDGKERCTTILEVIKPKQTTERGRAVFSDDESAPQPTSPATSVHQLPLQQPPSNGQPTESELAKYVEYERLRKANGFNCKPLEQWLEHYRRHKS